MGIRNVLRQHDLPQGKHWTERWAQIHPPDWVLCNSRFTHDSLESLYSDVPAQVLYPPVPNGSESLGLSGRDVMRRDLALPPESIVLIQIGRMEPVKGHVLTLQALSLLRDVPRWICLIVGGVQRNHEALYMKSLKDKAKDCGISERVRFLGQRRDIFDLLTASDVFVQGNTGPETFGIVFVEALYAGLPVVTSDLGGAREILNRDYGVLVPTGDAQALAQALRILIADPALRSKYRLSGPARANELCNPGRQTRRFYELLVQN